MSERQDDDLLRTVRAVWEQRDPVPDGLVARLQATAALADADLGGLDLDVELMLLVERSAELAGTRGTSATAYTLRFAHDGVDLLVRVSGEAGGARIDGWVVPPTPVTVSLLRGDDVLAGLEVGDTGRFEVTDLAPGLLRLRLEPRDGGTTFMTPAFEI